MVISVGLYDDENPNSIESVVLKTASPLVCLTRIPDLIDVAKLKSGLTLIPVPIAGII